MKITCVQMVLCAFLTLASLPLFADEISSSPQPAPMPLASPSPSSVVSGTQPVTVGVAPQSGDADIGPQTKAASAYSEVSWPTLLRGMIKVNALDVMNDDVLLDEYATITECQIYEFFYKDDFKWNNVRKAIRQSISLNLNSFPTMYHYDSRVQLDRYDFGKQLYKFTEKSTIQHVNTFDLLESQNTGCNDIGVKNLPHQYKAVVSDPITIPGIPLRPKDAEFLIHLLDNSGNTDHILYTSFNVRVVYAQPLIKTLDAITKGKMIYRQSAYKNDMFRFDIKLDNVQFYADQEKTKLIYTYSPK